jgi:molybdopterin converting factor small subunit
MRHRMQIHLHLFSILRGCLPSGTEGGQATVDLPDGTSLADVVVHFGIDQQLRIAPGKSIVEAGWQILVNGKYEGNLGRVLREGDQVSIFPPLAGG